MNFLYYYMVIIMKMIYVVNFDGEKNRHEQLALECFNYHQVLDHIIEDLESDAEYFRFSLEAWGEVIHGHRLGVIYIECDDEIGIDVNDDECSDVQTIIETDLDICSNIVNKIVINN